MALLGAAFPTQLAGTEWLAQPIDQRVEQMEAPSDTAVPVVSIEACFAEDLHQEVVELTEGTDDDETGRHLLLEVGLGFSVPVLEGQTGLSEAATDRGLTPFRLRAFSGRGSPRA